MNKITVDYFKEFSFAHPDENILYDDVLLHLAQEGKIGNTLRIWESPVYFAVLGRTGKAHEDLNLGFLQNDKIPVLRRSSGGGTVLQGPGCFNYSLILSKEKFYALADLRRSYRVILEEVLTVLQNLGVVGGFRPICDLALVDGDRKFSGNAQRRGRNYILHHGTILYDFDLTLIAKYLAMPRDIPEYRKGRSHVDFVTNVPVIKKDLIAEFKSHFGPGSRLMESSLTDQERQVLAKFLSSRSPILDF